MDVATAGDIERDILHRAVGLLLEEQEEVLEQVVRQASRHVDAIEERLLSNHVQRNRADLARLRRMLLRFQRLLAPEPAAMFRLLNRPPAWIDHPWFRSFASSPRSLP